MALTKITSTNIGANAVTSSALNLTTLSAGNTVITGTASVSTTLSAGNTTITGFANVTGAGSGTFTPYNDPLVVKGTDYTYLHLKGTNNQAAVIYNRNGTTGWFHGLDNSGNMKLAAMAAMDGTGLGNAKDGSAALYADTSSRVLMPSQPSFFVSDTNSSAVQQSELVFTTTSTSGRHNIGSHYSASTGRFTAPVTGYYQFTYQLRANSTTSYFHPRFKLNGNSLGHTHTIWGGALDYKSVGYTCFMSLSAGDYVSVETSGSQNNTGALEGGQCSFSGRLIG